jgi:hypothetical protein
MWNSRVIQGLVIAAILCTAPVAARQGDAEKLMITAMAVNMSNVGTSAVNQVVEITINRWSTPEERTHLIRTMIEKGEKALLSELQKTPSHGRFAIPGWVGPDPHELRLGYDLHYAWQTAQPDGSRRIVIMTDRYIGFEELRARPRTVDYPFTLFEIRVDKSGSGEGKMAVATRISFDKAKNTMELENYSSEPVRLQSLKLKSVK